MLPWVQEKLLPTRVYPDYVFFLGLHQPLLYNALVPPRVSVTTKSLPISRITLTGPACSMQKDWDAASLGGFIYFVSDATCTIFYLQEEDYYRH